MVRAAILLFGKSTAQDKLLQMGRALAKGIESQGATVEVFDPKRSREAKLTSFHYVAIGCEVTSWFKGKLPPELAETLSSAGKVLGKRCFGFVPKSFLGSDATLLKLMKAMEHEGMMVQFSEVFSSPDEAQACGAKLKLQ